MKNLFERTSSNWVRYSEYEWKETEDGTLYLTPTKTAQPSIYDPLSEYQRIVLDAINIGRMELQKKNAAGDTKGHPAICGKIRSAWFYDSSAYHAGLYGL